MRRFARLSHAAALLVVAIGCGGDSERPHDSSRAAERERGNHFSALPLKATRETTPVPGGGDAADDPAIWVNRARPPDSAIVGTNKDGGIAVYDMAGRQIHYRADGEINNVDIRDGFPLAGQRVVLTAAGNRSDNTIALYRLDQKTRRLANVAARKIHPGVETYGSCLYRSARTGRTYYFVTSKSGQIEQWEVFEAEGGRVDALRVRSLEVASVAEGCVADDRLARLYVSEESKGIWRFDAEPGADGRGELVDSTGAEGHLTADVEGLAIAYTSARAGYLIASSQGSSSFVVYRRAGSNGYVTEFEVAGGNGVDGVEGTDGIDVTTAGLGAPFEGGLFVVQDDDNDSGNQNFKLVPWPPSRLPDRPRSESSSGGKR